MSKNRYRVEAPAGLTFREKIALEIYKRNAVLVLKDSYDVYHATGATLRDHNRKLARDALAAADAFLEVLDEEQNKPPSSAQNWEVV